MSISAVGNSFHVAGPWYAKERCPYNFNFIVGILRMRVSEEEHKHLAGVYTWVMSDRYVGLEPVSEM